MPVIIPNELANYAKHITLEVDFNLFTDRQIKNIVKQIRTGCISRGTSMTSHLARWLRRQDKTRTPYAFFMYDTYDIRWRDIPFGHPFFEAVKRASSMVKISEPNTSKWVIEAMDENIKKADEQVIKGSINAYRLGEYKKIIKKAMKVEQPLSLYMEEFLTKLEKRELGIVPIQVKEVKSWE